MIGIGHVVGSRRNSSRSPRRSSIVSAPADFQQKEKKKSLGGKGRMIKYEDPYDHNEEHTEVTEEGLDAGNGGETEEELKGKILVHLFWYITFSYIHSSIQHRHPPRACDYSWEREVWCWWSLLSFPLES